MLILGICIGDHATETAEAKRSHLLDTHHTVFPKTKRGIQGGLYYEKNLLTCRFEQSEFARRKVVTSTKPIVEVAANFVSAP
jgi:hypothetical protein